MNAQRVSTCGTCGRSWDDAVITSMTPVPAARCPFEYFHDGEDVPADWPVQPIATQPQERQPMSFTVWIEIEELDEDGEYVDHKVVACERPGKVEVEAFALILNHIDPGIVDHLKTRPQYEDQDGHRLAKYDEEIADWLYDLERMVTP